MYVRNELEKVWPVTAESDTRVKNSSVIKVPFNMTRPLFMNIRAPLTPSKRSLTLLSVREESLKLGRFLL